MNKKCLHLIGKVSQVTLGALGRKYEWARFQL